MDEIWKPIKGFEGFYEVSNLGNVRSLDRTLSIGRKVKGKLLSPGKASNGYLSVSLGRSNTKMVHNLVAETFLNHEPCGFDKVVNHKDFNKENNAASNLEIVSNRENTNGKHLKLNKSSQYTGVSFVTSKNRWQASIRINGEAVYLGRHKTELAALNELNKTSKCNTTEN